MRRALQLALGGLLLLAPAGMARAQVGPVVIDPALGPRPSFGPGGFISNGNGYRSYGPNGYGGYFTGLYEPGLGQGNGPSPYYSPVFSSMLGAPRPDVAARPLRSGPEGPYPGRVVLYGPLGRPHPLPRLFGR